MNTNISQEYLAGFLDGEGYLGIMKHSNKTKRGYSYVCAIKVAQKYSQKTILEEIQKQIGGHLDKRREHSGNTNDSIMLAFRGCKNVKKVLNYVYPFLIVKKKQADILLKFIEIGTPTTRIPGIVDEEMDKMYEIKKHLYDEIRTLNFRGKNGAAETK